VATCIINYNHLDGCRLEVPEGYRGMGYRPYKERIKDRDLMVKSERADETDEKDRIKRAREN